jgi:hypothetical protein
MELLIVSIIVYVIDFDISGEKKGAVITYLRGSP